MLYLFININIYHIFEILNTMARKKSLVVPQEGTQPSSIPTPIDNMLSGNSKKQSRKTSIEAAEKPATKRATSFNIDTELVRQFKAVCATQGRTMSSVLEEFIKSYVSGK